MLGIGRAEYNQWDNNICMKGFGTVGVNIYEKICVNGYKCISALNFGAFNVPYLVYMMLLICNFNNIKFCCKYLDIGKSL